MTKQKKLKFLDFRAPDGRPWRVEVTNPGSSNALVLFRHPDATTHLDRYAWYIARGPEARNVTGRLDPASVLAALGERDLQRLFRSSYGVGENRETHRSV
jgi:hypothetical protein